jgi:hypothetical protein
MVPHKNSLQRKLDWTKVGIRDDEYALPSFPPKSIKQIIELIDSNRSHEISIFEWLMIVEDEEQWADLAESENYNACRAVWSAICTHDELGDIVFFKIAQEFDDGVYRVVSHLTTTMKIARSAKNLTHYSSNKIDWLLALQERDFSSLARMCFNRNLTIKPYLLSLNLPISNHYQWSVTEHLVSVAFNEYIDLNQLDNWLVACVENEMVKQKKTNLLSSIITHLDSDLIINKTKRMIESNSLPFAENTLWYQFKDEIKEKLRNLFDLSSYYSLDAITYFLCNPKVMETLVISDIESKQIRSRSIFWSNYAKHFSRIRVLLPENTKRLFDDFNDESLSYVSRLGESADDRESEVFLFEFDKIIVVEILRGAISETRFFKKNEWNGQRLFEADNLSLDHIRSLSHLDVHDHVVGWQFFCEKLLRTTYKITADESVTSFRGLPSISNRYSPVDGLPKISDEILKERSLQLGTWVELFWAREFKTEKYGQQKGFKLKSNVYLTKAMLEKQCGNQAMYEEYIHKAANQGNSEAMWQLGQLKIKDRQGGAKTRQYGEEWIRKAANAGHKDAIEAAKRYRI